LEPIDLNSYWSRVFPECPPVGFLFKHFYQDRCHRVSYFPDGRRAPETKEEYDEVCSRQNEILTRLCDGDPRVVLITTSYSSEEDPVRDQKLLNKLDPAAKFLHSVGVHELALEFDFPTYWHLFMSEWKFAPGQFDKIMRLTAQGSMFSGIFNVIILIPESTRLMYIFDGGTDIVMETPEARNELRDALES